jgi:hypothetical protein
LEQRSKPKDRLGSTGKKNHGKIKVLRVRVPGPTDYQYRLDKYSWDDAGQVLVIYKLPERRDDKVAAFHGTFHYWFEYRNEEQLDDSDVGMLGLHIESAN